MPCTSSSTRLSPTSMRGCGNVAALCVERGGKHRARVCFVDPGEISMSTYDVSQTGKNGTPGSYNGPARRVAPAAAATPRPRVRLQRLGKRLPEGRCGGLWPGGVWQGLRHWRCRRIEYLDQCRFGFHYRRHALPEAGREGRRCRRKRQDPRCRPERVLEPYFRRHQEYDPCIRSFNASTR
jgi:hypothetical protein